MHTVAVSDRAIALVRFDRILFPTDFSACSDRALAHLLGLAAMYRSQVFVVHVLPPESPARSDTVSDFVPRLFNLNRYETEKSLRALENSGVLAHVEHSDVVETGDVCDELQDIIRRQSIDLVLMGSHGRGGLQKFLHGSVAEEISRRASCPVMIVGPCVSSVPPDYRLQHILFATEFANGALSALRYALGITQKYQADLKLLHVCTFVERSPLVESDVALVIERERLQALIPSGLELPSPPSVFTRIGNKTEAILATAADFQADLIIIGVHSTHTLTAVTHFPWTVAHQIICQATCPVLTVRG